MAIEKLDDPPRRHGHMPIVFRRMVRGCRTHVNERRPRLQGQGKENGSTSEAPAWA